MNNKLNKLKIPYDMGKRMRAIKRYKITLRSKEKI
jgi:hypothetical protein